MTCTPCLVTYQSTRYRVYPNGAVKRTTTPDIDSAPYESDEVAQAVRHEAARQRRNRNARERHQAMTDLGLVRVRGNLGGVYYE